MVEGGAYRKIGRGTGAPEPGKPDRYGRDPTILEEDITQGWAWLGRVPRESDRSIVVRKRGNSCGAKGPDWEHVAVDMKGEPLERKFHYGRTGRGNAYPSDGERDTSTQETLSTETETEPKGEAGAEVSVLRVV